MTVDQVEWHQTIQVSDIRFHPIILLEKLLDALGASILRGNVQGCVSSAPTEVVAKQDSNSWREFIIVLERIPILFILCCQSSVVSELKVEVLNHGVRSIGSDLISHHLKVIDWIEVSLFVLGLTSLLLGQLPRPRCLTHALLRSR